MAQGRCVVPEAQRVRSRPLVSADSPRRRGRGDSSPRNYPRRSKPRLVSTEISASQPRRLVSAERSTSGAAATRLRGLSTSEAAASPRLVSTDSPRRGSPRSRRDSTDSPRRGSPRRLRLRGLSPSGSPGPRRSKENPARRDGHSPRGTTAPSAARRVSPPQFAARSSRRRPRVARHSVRERPMNALSVEPEKIVSAEKPRPSSSPRAAASCRSKTASPTATPGRASRFVRACEKTPNLRARPRGGICGVAAPRDASLFVFFSPGGRGRRAASSRAETSRARSRTTPRTSSSRRGGRS